MAIDTFTHCSIMAALGKVVLERQPNGMFVQSGCAPDWYVQLNQSVPQPNLPLRVEALFPFLEVFLPEAEAVWQDGGPNRVESDIWCETAADGDEVPLQATALHLGPRRVLVITRCDELYHKRRLFLQRARELRFTYDALCREMEQKDILMHCIVHDLASPLQTILGVLSSIDERKPPGDEGVMIAHALDAALRQRSMIREILSVFASEQVDMDALTEETADLCAATKRAVSAYEVIARSRNVTIKQDLPVSPCLVIAEEPRLVRVLSNLLDNAVRHSPGKGHIRVTAREDSSTIEVSIQDQGQGVPPSLGPQLFQRFGRGTGPESGTGLGLYFCRITVERWGGAIGYAAPAEGGARFWFRLRKAHHQSEGAGNADEIGQ